MAVTPDGGLRMTVLITEFPFGVRLLNFAASDAGDDDTVAGDTTRPKIFAGAATLGSANAASIATIKKPTNLRIPFIAYLPRNISRHTNPNCGE